MRTRAPHRALTLAALTTTVAVYAARAHADAPPRLLDAPRVEARADTLGRDATVLLELTIDERGAVSLATVLRGLEPELDARVLEAARAMRFRAAERNGAPIAARIRFRYRVHRSPPPSATPVRPPTIVSAPAPQAPPARAPRAPRGAPTRRARADDEGAITVRGRNEPGAATRASFRAEELTTVPGTFGEPTRIVATQPGVARTPFGLGYFVVRGASFENTGFFIDGYPVLVLYHLAAGPAVISSRLVGQLDFYPGGYPVQFGRFSAGIISLETRPPPTTRPRGEFEVDLFRAAALAVLPFDQGRGSVAFAFRRSYYDFLLPQLLPGVSVNYTDAQLRADYRFSSRLRGSVFAFLSSDVFDRTLAVGDGASANSARDALNYDFGRAIAKLEYRDAWVTAHASAMLGYDRTGVVQSDPGRPDRGINAAGVTFGSRLWARIAPTPALTTTVGLDLLGYVYDVGLSYAAPSGLGSVPMPLSNPRVQAIRSQVLQTGLAGYAEQTLRVLPLELTAGLRVEQMRYMGNEHVTVDPRVVARMRVHRAVTAIASSGYFHQAPPFFALVPDVGNPNLFPQRAWQSSLGVEATLPLDLEARVTGFFNRMWQLPRATYAIVDTPQGPRRAYALSDGEGRAWGLELQLRRKLEHGIYGWVSYTLSRSERFIGDGRVVPFTYDQTHVLNLAASWDPHPQWRVGVRFQLATGAPTSRITGTVYDADVDGFRPTYVSEAERLPTYHQLDVRVDYKFRLGPWSMAAFVDVLNAYYAQNAEGWIYQYDYADRRPRPGLPILPAFGLRGEL